MTQAVGQLRIDLSADWADFRTEMSRASDGLGRFGTKFGQVAGQVGQASLRMAGVVSAAFVGFAIASVQAAEEMEGIRGAFRTAFGDSADAAEEWASRTAGALRLSQRDIREMATGFQNLFGEIAPTNEAAAEASMRFTQLARDFAALKNIRPEDSVSLFTAALQGNARGLRAYGIDLSEGAVRAEALRTGVIRANQELSNQQAVLVRASILMRELGSATGETAASADSAEAATQRQAAAFEDASASLGNALLPAMTTLKNITADVVNAFTRFFTNTVPQFIEGNDQLLAVAYRVREAFRGNFDVGSNQQIIASIRRVREETNRAGAEGRPAIRGLTDDTAAYAEQLAGLAAQTANGGLRGRAGRSWAEEHAADIQRLREQIDPTGEALRRFNEQSAIAARAGLDVAAAQRALAAEFIETVGGVDRLKGSLETLPPAIREVAEQMANDALRERAQELKDELADFADTINDRFDGESAIRREIEQINAAMEAGLITAETYKAAMYEVSGQAERDAEIADQMARDAEERDRAWEGVSRAIADVATGTRDLEDAWKSLILQFIRAQMIEPFLNRLFQGGKGGGGLFGGLFGGGGGLGGFFGGLFGGGKANGGPVFPGMAYEVGERGRELFVPDQAGTIIPHGQYGGGVTMNIYTPDANSFRASRRQIARNERRAIGAN